MCLEDGREWVLGGKDATLADIHAGWIMVWLRDMVSALPDDLFPRDEYPKAHAWFDRYSKARDEAMKKMETEGLSQGDEWRGGCEEDGRRAVWRERLRCG